MDSIHPIVPGPSSVSARLPVEPLERITRERDRPARERGERRRREPGEPAGPPAFEDEHDMPVDATGAVDPTTPPNGLAGASGAAGEDDGERPHVDVRA